ncbi:hypothetical protein ASE49_12755 [Novosphingobium sp. Leaf2]|nr:hypothetical protein ASE49_12755 [Novosphingobium sp. Leaf2]
MARALATYLNPWLLRRLVLYRDRLHEAGSDVGELGPVIIVDPGDTLQDIEKAAGIAIGGDPDMEVCVLDNGWAELVFVTSDDGSGAVILIPDREGIDPDLLAIVRTHAIDVATLADAAAHPSPDSAT